MHIDKFLNKEHFMAENKENYFFNYNLILFSLALIGKKRNEQFNENRVYFAWIDR